MSSTLQPDTHHSNMLALIIGSTSYDGVHTGLSLAANASAMGRNSIIFVHATATQAVFTDHSWPEDTAVRATGAPTIADLIETALELGARIIVCQTGLILHNRTADHLDPRMETGGMIDFLQRIGTVQPIIC